jgi:hypothetical protein
VQNSRIHRLAHYQSRLTKLCCYAWLIDFDVGHGRHLSRKILFGKQADMNLMRHPVMATYLACLNPNIRRTVPLLRSKSDTAGLPLSDLSPLMQVSLAKKNYHC